MTRRTLPTAMTALAMVALALLGCGPTQAATSLLPAPDFTLTLLDGKTVTLAGLMGKPVLLYFWWSQ